MHAFKQVFGEDGEANLLAESLPRIPGSHPQNLKKKRGGDQIDVGVEDCNPGYTRSCLKTLFKK